MAENIFLLLSKLVSGLGADSRLEIIFYQNLEDNVTVFQLEMWQREIERGFF